MKILLVTEKCSRSSTERDGGARLVETIQKAFGDSLYIMQFGPEADASATWHFDYPSNNDNRFERRLDNANFIAEQVKAVESYFTHVIFVHVSMQFGLSICLYGMISKFGHFPCFSRRLIERQEKLSLRSILRRRSRPYPILRIS